jgi:hypothetical protein
MTTENEYGVGTFLREADENALAREVAERKENLRKRWISAGVGAVLPVVCGGIEMLIRKDNDFLWSPMVVGTLQGLYGAFSGFGKGLELDYEGLYNSLAFSGGALCSTIAVCSLSYFYGGKQNDTYMH